MAIKKKKAKVAAKAKVTARTKSKVKAKVTAKAKSTAKAKASAVVQRAASMQAVLTPLDDRILVQMSETLKQNGLIYLPDTKNEQNRGVVLAVGRGHKNKFGKIRPMDVRVGDEILFTPHAANKIRIASADLWIVRESDVLGVIALDS